MKGATVRLEKNKWSMNRSYTVSIESDGETLIVGNIWLDKQGEHSALGCLLAGLIAHATRENLDTMIVPFKGCFSETYKA